MRVIQRRKSNSNYMIGVLNYGLGNLKSIEGIINNVGGQCKLINSPSELNSVEKLILPGVGAFDHGMNGLINGGWIEPLNEFVIEKKLPILGICLGMQLMCVSSEEGVIPGLAWISASVKKFTFSHDTSFKIPHMGWNTLNILQPNELLNNNEFQNRFYFVHSYFVSCNDSEDIISTTNYGHEFVSAFKKGNIYGMQFHPEKSHRFGKSVFKKFITL